jgi:hypothetical protein
MEAGDQMFIRLHEGALKGGGTHAFTSLVGMMVASSHATSKTESLMERQLNDI